MNTTRIVDGVLLITTRWKEKNKTEHKRWKKKRTVKDKEP
jgi:hypothetical protein